jgi:N-acetyl-gamma-glutamyl-phosphate reductase
MNNHASVPVGVLGASGYVGQELVGILSRHPGASLVFASAESAAGEPLSRLVPGAPDLTLVPAGDAPLTRAEVVFSCLPHGESSRWVHEVRASGRRAVDLSSDFRLAPDAVYGLTEVVRPRLPAAELVANPGCYPTAALLALLPLARRGLIDPSREIIIDAASGVTGAGRNPKKELMFGEVSEDFRAYSVGNTHRHLAELRARLSDEGGFTGDVVFTPHLLPVRRGILETIHVPLSRVLDQATAEGLYEAAYAGEPCVFLIRGGVPSLRDVVYRNRVAIGVVPVTDVRRPRLTVIAAIDNLVKGAAGQAVQNLNVMLGLQETAGLVC